MSKTTHTPPAHVTIIGCRDVQVDHRGVLESQGSGVNWTITDHGRVIELRERSMDQVIFISRQMLSMLASLMVDLDEECR